MVDSLEDLDRLEKWFEESVAREGMDGRRALADAFESTSRLHKNERSGWGRTPRFFCELKAPPFQARPAPPPSQTSSLPHSDRAITRIVWLFFVVKKRYVITIVSLRSGRTQLGGVK